VTPPLWVQYLLPGQVTPGGNGSLYGDPLVLEDASGGTEVSNARKRTLEGKPGAAAPAEATRGYVSASVGCLSFQEMVAGDGHARVEGALRSLLEVGIRLVYRYGGIPTEDPRYCFFPQNASSGIDRAGLRYWRAVRHVLGGNVCVGLSSYCLCFHWGS
jgi:hypothetical protein